MIATNALPSRLQVLRSLCHKPGEFPESERAALTTLALPMYPELTNVQRERVVRGIVAHYEATGRLSRRLAA